MHLTVSSLRAGLSQPRVPGGIFTGLGKAPELPGSIISVLRLIASFV